MTDEVEKQDSWDEMIMNFILAKKDMISKQILRNRQEHQAQDAP